MRASASFSRDCPRLTLSKPNQRLRAPLSPQEQSGRISAKCAKPACFRADVSISHLPQDVNSLVHVLLGPGFKLRHVANVASL
ncbi:Hypothetical protein, putative [Bodo saltans]|uniref:Uncharacterized protein n=1 Tax=Bodo saltans TaxID=75058 RepID=A0A0S4JF44_BODSA|nr:Hypothetical protein, putative [Bodo saltans]|eukprot:CUG87011.1 Hypothetical protein, putative [Bodo saltans]